MQEQVQNRKDFISVDKKTAISSSGDIFNVGDLVCHEGAKQDQVGTILKFVENQESNEVHAYTEYGWASISFLYPYPD
jgi:hydroxymethylpyrimidine pyrophosphatase-like HAD family hydrolase